MARYLVDVTLYTGQHLQAEPAHTELVAYERAYDLCCNTMVEDASVIDMKTGEVVSRLKNLAATWRVE